MFALTKRLKKVFWLLFLKKVTARRVGEKPPFLFCQAFFFVAILPKKKASQRQTIFKYQDSLAAFL
jgi:hypothetical protein